MKLTVRILFLIILLNILFGVQAVLAESNEPRTILTDTDESMMRLDGEWYAFPMTLLTTEEIKTRLQTEKIEQVSLPNAFEKLTGEINSYATHSIKVEIPEKYLYKTLAVHIPFQYSAYRLFMNDVEIAKNGEVGTDPNSHVSERARQ